MSSCPGNMRQSLRLSIPLSLTHGFRICMHGLHLAVVAGQNHGPSRRADHCLAIEEDGPRVLGGQLGTMPPGRNVRKPNPILGANHADVGESDRTALEKQEAATIY